MAATSSAPVAKKKRASKRALDPASKLLLGAAAAVQVAHIGVQLVVVHAERASIALQITASLLACAVCFRRSQRSGYPHERQLWLPLLAGFALWSFAECSYLLAGWYPSSGSFRLLSDVLGLIFPFPLVLVASAAYKASNRDPVVWFDTAQACMLFGTLIALVYPQPGILTLSQAYQLESLVLLLTIALRYAATERGAERAFYHPLVLFAGIYAGCTVLGETAWRHGLVPVKLIDLCWSLPFTVFSVTAVFAGRDRSYPAYRPRGGFASPSHLRGLGALALAVMSLAATGMLACNRTVPGAVTATAIFLLFAARTSMREWQLHTAHQGLEHSAMHDSLTGLANRSLLQRELTARLEFEAPQAKQRTALLFIDLDRFKTINDGLGHAFGDLLLIRVAELLRAAVRPQDVVARHGGDEFVILLENVDGVEAEELAERVVASLRDPLTLDGRIIHVTASIGVVVSYPGATADGMLQTADCAMYKAKGGGKDRMEAFVPSMLTAAQEKLELETDLREALLKESIDVLYQPIYNLPDLTIVGFEALVRWHHPRRGIMDPSEFIPLAEDAGLIAELGRQVLRKACTQCQAWNLRFGVPLRMAVNVSARQFALAGFVDEIATILRISELHPSLLKLEVTESLLLNGYQAAEQELAKARALGMSICLDDFGTGYSSLSYLLHFPFDVIKIDRSFVNHLDHDERRAQVVRMVIELAAQLRKQVIAEGVESVAELERLRSFGCDMVQGYLLSRPLVPREVDAVLLKASNLGASAWPTPAEQADDEETSPWALDGDAIIAALPRLNGRADPRGVPTGR
jgi:diguanylate cyclase (GGDEF)-like protein